MKIAVLAGTIGGIVGFRLDMMLAFAAKGHEVVAFSGLERPELRRVLGDHNIPFEKIDVDRKSVNPFKEFLLIRQLKSAFDSGNFDAVVAFTPKIATYSAIAAKLAGVKKRVAVYTGLGFAFASQSFLGLLLRVPFSIIYGLGMRCATDVLFQNPDDKLIAEKFFMSSAPKDALMNGSGVNTAKFPFTEPPKEEIVFTFVGRLIKHKGVREFIYAADKIKRKYPKVKFMMLGSTDNNPSSIGREEFEKIKAEGNIDCKGFVADIASYIANTSVAVLPSYREGCPRSMLEAMSMGRALILADAPGTRVPIELGELGARQKSAGMAVMEGKNGFLVLPRNGDALAEAMERFVKDPSLVVSMGKKSREIAEEKFDVDKVNDFLLSVLEK